MAKIADFVIEYRIHASQRMFRRDIHEDNVETVLKNEKIIVIITTYEPDKLKWTSDFSGRIK